MAAVALSRDFWVVMLGVALGILTMRFAAQAFTVLIQHEPILVPTAYLLVLNISFQLLITDVTYYLGNEIHIAAWQKFLMSLLTLLAAVGYAHAPWLQKPLRPVLQAIGRILGAIDRGLNVLLTPVTYIFDGLVTIGRSLLGKKPGDPEKHVRRT